MKKILLIAYVLLSSFTFTKTVEQPVSTSINQDSERVTTVLNDLTTLTSLATQSVDPTNNTSIDPTTIQAIVDTGIAIGVAANGGNEIIKGVPNGFLHVLGALLIGGFIRFFEKRKLRKKGLLIDKTPPPNI